MNTIQFGLALVMTLTTTLTYANKMDPILSPHTAQPSSEHSPADKLKKRGESIALALMKKGPTGQDSKSVATTMDRYLKPQTITVIDSKGILKQVGPNLLAKKGHPLYHLPKGIKFKTAPVYEIDGTAKVVITASIKDKVLKWTLFITEINTNNWMVKSETVDWSSGIVKDIEW